MIENHADLLVIAGPTAVGKTDIGIELARQLNGEIVSADARQIYRYMNIGTAKPTLVEQARAVHHLIDVADPDDTYSAGRYAKEAAQAVEDILKRNCVPILVGGSGLYLQALIEGFAPISDIPPDVRRRIQIESRQDLEGLFKRLLKIDPIWAERVHPNDRQRIVRGIEVYEVTGKRLSALQNLPRVAPGDWKVHWFGLNLEREVLYERIDRRVDCMVEDGLIEEVIELKKKGYGTGLISLNTFGYQEIFDYLDGNLKLDSALDCIKKGTRNYAKRQQTWFGRNSRMIWSDPTKIDPIQRIMAHLKLG